MSTDVSVADAQAVIDEAMAYLDDQRTACIEIMSDIREEGGAYGYSLAQFVAPYVSKQSLMRLFQPSINRFWGRDSGEAVASSDGKESVSKVVAS